jgi:hypothetical protein
MDTPTKVLAGKSQSKKFGSYFSKIGKSISGLKFTMYVFIFTTSLKVLQLESCFSMFLKQAIVCASRFFPSQFGLKYKLFYKYRLQQQLAKTFIWF